jgi:hypothetical protein
MLIAVASTSGVSYTFTPPQQELDAGQHPHRAALPPSARRGAGGLPRLLLGRVVDLVQEVEVLVLAEDVRHIRHPLHPSRTSGSTTFFAVFGVRWLDITIELSFSGVFFMSGTWMSVSKLPMLPDWFSRTTNFRWYLPGASVKPVEYCTFFFCTCWFASSAASPSRARCPR